MKNVESGFINDDNPRFSVNWYPVGSTLFKDMLNVRLKPEILTNSRRHYTIIYGDVVNMPNGIGR